MSSNLAGILTETAAEHGDRPALKLDDTVVTYAQLDDGSARVTAMLREKGIEPGDRLRELERAILAQDPALALAAAAPPVEAPARPPGLSKLARAEWDRVVPELLRRGVVAKIDRSIVMNYCEAVSLAVLVYPPIAQVIVYIVAAVILLWRPRGLLGVRGVME